VKFFCGAGSDVALLDFIPIFHRWIQTAAVDDLLIDVADYSHVPEGPGVLLVGHEGIYSVDERAGRRGLAYWRRRGVEDSFDGTLTASLRAAARACRLLEEELGGRMRFKGNELEIYATDRLTAPNSEDAMSQLRPALDALRQKLFPGLGCEVARELDPRELLTVNLKSSTDVAFSDLAGRILG
jgi:hypothetical protein